jgi:thiol-disulfide isomerase/thioredoxin
MKEKNFNYDFAVRDSNGKKISFDEFKGKVLFINLWATWCGPCRVEMPTIQQLYNEQAGDDKIKFVMLSLDTEKTVKNIEGYIKGNSYTFPVYRPSGYLPELFQVPSIPVTFIVSKQGKVVIHEVGATNFNTPRYKKLLAEEAAK